MGLLQYLRSSLAGGERYARCASPSNCDALPYLSPAAQQVRYRPRPSEKNARRNHGPEYPGPGHCNNLFVLLPISEKILGGRSQGRAVQFYEMLTRTNQRLGDLKEAAAVCTDAGCGHVVFA